MTQLTQEEKIDYIFKHIKSEKRNRIFKILFKILLIIVVFYGSQYLIKKIWADQIQKTISEQIWEITAPIVKDLVKDLDISSVWWINKDKITELIKENPELLDNFKNNDY